MSSVITLLLESQIACYLRLVTGSATSCRSLQRHLASSLRYLIRCSMMMISLKSTRGGRDLSYLSELPSSCSLLLTCDEAIR